jgi:hypothetical protein
MLPAKCHIVRPSVLLQRRTKHLTVHTSLVVGFVKREHVRGLPVGQVDDVHAAGRCHTVGGQRGAARDHLVGIPVHECPVSFGQFGTQRSRARPIATVNEVLHASPLWSASALCSRVGEWILPTPTLNSDEPVRTCEGTIDVTSTMI